MRSPVAQQVKKLPAMQETQEMQIWSLGWEDHPEEERAFFSGNSCLRSPMDREGSLVVYSPVGWKELDTTEHKLS